MLLPHNMCVCASVTGVRRFAHFFCTNVRCVIFFFLSGAFFADFVVYLHPKSSITFDVYLKMGKGRRRRAVAVFNLALGENLLNLIRMHNIICDFIAFSMSDYM